MPGMTGLTHQPPVFPDYAAFSERVAARLAPPPAGAPLVSVITVCRNAATTLPQTLRSVVAQTYPWIEHIVIDGASNDGTLDLLGRAERLSGWVSEPDQGISDAFNKGLSLARGAIIGILNADDAYLPDAVAASVEALQANPGSAWAFGDCTFLRDGREVLHRAGDPEYARCIGSRMPVINHPTVFVRRQAYERCGLFRTDLRLAMDYELLLRFHRAGLHGHYVPRTLARMALGGASCQHILEAYRESAEVSVAHGEPRWRARLTRMRMSVLPLIRIAAQVCGVSAAWRWLRGR
jgi:GT2 family glycosyltransferase